MSQEHAILMASSCGEGLSHGEELGTRYWQILAEQTKLLLTFDKNVQF